MDLSKKVGVIIPIYNTQKYLKECLESVIHQTYQNLEVLLIDDGSCDESLEIAKEYVRKDSRLILFIKDNRGQASARNVGIDYFAKGYGLEVVRNEDTLWHYRIKGENVYAIKAVLKNTPIDTTPSIDYLIFLDSDDYWALECVEECVKRMKGVEIVWLDYKRKYEEGCREEEKPTEVEKCGFNEGKITPKQFLQRSYEVGRKWYAFTWQGMIDFEYLKSIHLRFLDTLVEEDHHFWILLLIQSRFIFILPHKLYFYRIRLYSMTNYGGKTSIRSVPIRLKPYLKDFRGNPMLLQKYCLAGSAAVMLVDIFQRMEKGLESSICVFLKEKILKRLCMLAMNLESFESDPMGFLPLLKRIKPYAREYKIGAYALVHKSLEYQLGLAIISSFKSFSNFLYSPFVIISIFKHYQKLSILQSQILQSTISNLKPYNLQFKASQSYNPTTHNLQFTILEPHNLQSMNLPLQSYWDYKEAEHLKKHLSFRIGKAILF